MNWMGSAMATDSQEKLIEALRRDFERATVDDLMPAEFSWGYLFARDEDGDYEIDFVALRWKGWRCAIEFCDHMVTRVLASELEKAK